jgi:hypothetical protein
MTVKPDACAQRQTPETRASSTWSGMRKRIGTTPAATSLLLGAAVGALWMLSWSRPYGLGFEKDAAPSSVVRSRMELTDLSFDSMRGGLDVRYYWRTNPTAPADLRRWEFSPVTNPKRLSEMPGQPTGWGFTGTPARRGELFSGQGRRGGSGLILSLWGFHIGRSSWSQ